MAPLSSSTSSNATHAVTNAPCDATVSQLAQSWCQPIVVSVGPPGGL